MRKIVHLSDPQFGWVDMKIAAALIKTVRDIKPDVTVVSGDLTQKAWKSEFKAARKFLDELPVPRLVVPGNHDIPQWYEPWARLVNPFRRYRTYIAADLEPSYADEEIALFGINTVHPWGISGGRVTSRQADDLAAKLRAAHPNAVKFLVGHHPFDLPERHVHKLIGGAKAFVERIAEAGLDAILSGHLHVYHTGLSVDRYDIAHRSTLIMHAGTSISTRTRHDEPNSFNVLLVEPPAMTVLSYIWDAKTGEFAAIEKARFARKEDGWRREEA